mmetsp:Transcript_3068/g.7211  ORF Transcript_3068/g.7211 Transcript_3068/m.7211 type:complete len:338 (-) Transcript_3068:188-1201(-)
MPAGSTARPQTRSASRRLRPYCRMRRGAPRPTTACRAGRSSTACWLARQRSSSCLSGWTGRSTAGPTSAPSRSSRRGCSSHPRSETGSLRRRGRLPSASTQKPRGRRPQALPPRGRPPPALCGLRLRGRARLVWRRQATWTGIPTVTRTRTSRCSAPTAVATHGTPPPRASRSRKAPRCSGPSRTTKRSWTRWSRPRAAPRRRGTASARAGTAKERSLPGAAPALNVPNGEPPTRLLMHRHHGTVITRRPGIQAPAGRRSGPVTSGMASTTIATTSTRSRKSPSTTKAPSSGISSRLTRSPSLRRCPSSSSGWVSPSLRMILGAHRDTSTRRPWSHY